MAARKSCTGSCPRGVKHENRALRYQNLRFFSSLLSYEDASWSDTQRRHQFHFGRTIDLESSLKRAAAGIVQLPPDMEVSTKNEIISAGKRIRDLMQFSASISYCEPSSSTFKPSKIYPGWSSAKVPFIKLRIPRLDNSANRFNPDCNFAGLSELMD
jgi:hypothetical protein